jgi:hypothetical protein
MNFIKWLEILGLRSMDKLSLFSAWFIYRFGRLKNRVSKSNSPYSGIAKGISSSKSDT